MLQKTSEEATEPALFKNTLSLNKSTKKATFKGKIFGFFLNVPKMGPEIKAEVLEATALAESTNTY